MKKKFILLTTVPLTFIFFKGQFQELKKVFDIQLVSSPGAEFDKVCKNENIVGHAIEMKREISLINDVFSLIRLVKLFYKLSPSIVHGNTPKGSLLAMIAAWITCVPHRIYYVHGLRYQGTEGLKLVLLKNMERLTCFFATDIFAVSEGIKKTLETEKISLKKIKIIGNGSINGINKEYFAPHNINIPQVNTKLNINQNDVVFGFVGRLVKDKGINELISAFIEVKKKYKNCKLLLVGNFDDGLDPLDAHVINEIKKNKDIICVGFQCDVRPYLKIMHLYVFPSYREGFGQSLLESAAMGIPAISSNITGCNEIIKDGYNGILIPAKSTEHLKEAMIKLIENPQLLASMASNTRPFVLSKYEQNLVWKNTIESYLQISS